ncbi:HAD family hydrolase [Fructobacillus ficulneus]|uniref:Haloacid dehalogenase n=1 Tax=Fructobacillus ficulneus TaxID=157463 RepID=A0A0K8MKG5_9LACO|nr:HAD family phosphatase [Fructobacillus ficulneus]GAP00385.1 haloacid dehalogenase [Fructobacillus ficulneus]
MDKTYAIFDLDGTLVDSSVYWTKLTQEFLVQHGLTEKAPNQLLQAIEQLTVDEAAKVIQDYFGLTDEPAAITAAINALMDQHYRQDIPAKPGVQAYLANLKNQGCQLALASTADKNLIHDCLKRLNLDQYFDFVLACPDFQTDKTSPIIYNLACQRWGVRPDQVAVYEDAVYAIKTAHQAGFVVVGVYDYQSNHDWQLIRNYATETLKTY